MHIVDYLDAAKAKHGLPSDYALAKKLGVTVESVSQLRTGKMHLSDKMAVKLADLLDKDRLELLVAGKLEKAKTPEAQEAWAELLNRISEGFLSLLLHAKSARGFSPIR